MRAETSSLFLDALASKKVERPPVWLMRQAGRYLPEYQELRARHTLSTLFHEPELAAEVTLMPLKRMPLDAAIVFSDLLVLAEAWGKKVFYPETGGPHIEPVVDSSMDLIFSGKEVIEEKLSYVFSTIKILKPELTVPLLGFSGAPFTLLCYLLEGRGGNGFQSVRFWMDYRKEEFKVLLDEVCDACIAYSTLQIEAGIDAIQIFDSWTHLLSKEEFQMYALPYWKKIQDGLVSLGVPVIFFSRSNSLYPELISSINPGGISFDEGRPMSSLRRLVPKGIAIQGNFSPEKLAYGSIQEIRSEALEMARSVALEDGIIFNLGHGVLPKTPIENVMTFLESVRSV